MELKSISNRKLSLLRKLNRKKYRQKEQLFLVEGARAVEQIIENKGLVVRELFFDKAQGYWKEARWERTASGIEVSTIDEKDFADVTDTDNPQGVLALCKMPGEQEVAAMADHPGLILATDAIQDPGNMGTIIRTASWFGAAGLLSGKGTVDLFHPKVVRSTAGATGTVLHARGELNEMLPVFEQKGWSILLLDAGPDSVPLSEIKKQDKMLVVIGNEAHGISPSLFAPGRQKVRIASPQKAHKVESLNAAIATSIALYTLM